MNTNSNNERREFPALRAVALATLAMPFLYLIYINFIYKGVPAPELPGLEVQTPPPFETYEKLIPVLTKATIDSPSYNSFFNLGLTMYQAQKFEECIPMFKKALEYDSNKALAWNNLAAAYGSLNMYKEEIDACEKALAIDPNLTLAKNNMAWAKSQLKK